MIINIVECKTLDDLQEIRNDERALRVEALAIFARILGPKHRESPDTVFETGYWFADMVEYDKCMYLCLCASKA